MTSSVTPVQQAMELFFKREVQIIGPVVSERYHLQEQQNINESTNTVYIRGHNTYSSQWQAWIWFPERWSGQYMRNRTRACHSLVLYAVNWANQSTIFWTSLISGKKVIVPAIKSPLRPLRTRKSVRFALLWQKIKANQPWDQGRVVQRWVSAKFQFKYESLKRKFSLILSVYNLTKEHPKKNRGNYPRKCYW